jgi:hypothetical protein
MMAGCGFGHGKPSKKPMVLPDAGGAFECQRYLRVPAVIESTKSID